MAAAQGLSSGVHPQPTSGGNRRPAEPPRHRLSARLEARGSLDLKAKPILWGRLLNDDIYVCINISIYMHLYVYLYCTCMYICMLICIGIGIYVYIYICICTCTHLPLWLFDTGVSYEFCDDNGNNMRLGKIGIDLRTV